MNYPSPEPAHDYDKKLEVSGFPGNLRRRFKAECARRGRSMSEVLIELAAAWTEQQEKPEREEGVTDASRQGPAQLHDADRPG